jgi:hypothetical protein
MYGGHLEWLAVGPHTRVLTEDDRRTLSLEPGRLAKNARDCF